MFLLIDAYNILKQIIPVKEIHQLQRQQFINLVLSYARRKNHYAVIVFDGGGNLWPSTEQKKHGSITYSGVRNSADDYIKKFIAENKNKEMLLISTDRALCSWAGMHRVLALDALDFYQFLKNELAPPKLPKKSTSTPIKMTHEVNEEIDQLMIQASEQVYHKSEESGDVKKNISQQHSKKERKLLQKIKKL